MTKIIYKINHFFNCDNKCLIYQFTYKVCGIQYVGSTVDRFRFRWNNYKSCQRDAADVGTPNPNYFHQHFLIDGHHELMNDYEIIFIVKTDFSDSTRREFIWMRVHKPHWILILMKIAIINFYPQLISILACDMLWLSDNYILMLMLEVSLSLVYHVISGTNIQFLAINSIFCVENCKNNLTLNRLAI